MISKEDKLANAKSKPRYHNSSFEKVLLALKEKSSEQGTALRKMVSDIIYGDKEDSPNNQYRSLCHEIFPSFKPGDDCRSLLSSFCNVFGKYWERFLSGGCAVSDTPVLLNEFYNEINEQYHWGHDANARYKSLSRFLHYGMIYLKSKWEDESRDDRNKQYTDNLDQYRGLDVEERTFSLFKDFFNFEERSVKEAISITRISDLQRSKYENVLHDRHVQFIKSISINPLYEREYLSNFDYLGEMAICSSLRDSNTPDWSDDLNSLRNNLLDTVTRVVRWLEKERVAYDASRIMSLMTSVEDLSYSVDERFRVDPFSHDMNGDLHIYEFTKESPELAHVYIVDKDPAWSSSILSKGKNRRSVIEPFTNIKNNKSDFSEFLLANSIYSMQILEPIMGRSIQSRDKRSDRSVDGLSVNRCGIPRHSYPNNNIEAFLWIADANLVLDYMYANLFIQAAVFFGLIGVSVRPRHELEFFGGLYPICSCISIPFVRVVSKASGIKNTTDPLDHVGNNPITALMKNLVAGWFPLLHARSAVEDSANAEKGMEYRGSLSPILGQLDKEGNALSYPDMGEYSEWMKQKISDNPDKLEKHLTLVRWMNVNDTGFCIDMIYSSCFEYLSKSDIGLYPNGDKKRSPVMDYYRPLFEKTMHSSDWYGILYGHLSRAHIDILEIRYCRSRTSLPSSLPYDSPSLGVLIGHQVETSLVWAIVDTIKISERLKDANVARYLYFLCVDNDVACLSLSAISQAGRD